MTVENPVPTIASVTPDPVTAGTPTTISVAGAGFSGDTVISILALGNLATTFVDEALVTADVPGTSPAFVGGTTTVVATNPGPGGGVSSPRTLNVLNPQAGVSSVAPGTVPQMVSATLTVTGTGFNDSTIVDVRDPLGAFLPGLPAPTVLTTGLLDVVIPAAALTTLGTYTVSASNPAPGGGLVSGANATFEVSDAIVITELLPDIVPVLPGGQTQTVFARGNLDATMTLYVNGFPLPTLFVAGPNPGEGLLRCTLDNSTMVPMSLEGAVTFNAVAPSGSTSNTVPLKVGMLPNGAANRGTIRRDPLQLAPGQPFSWLLEDGVPNAPVLLVGQLEPAPVPTPIPVLGGQLLVGNPLNATFTVLLDGIGFMGPPDPLARFDAQGNLVFNHPILVHDPNGTSRISVQALYADPTPGAGLRLTWTLFPEPLF